MHAHVHADTDMKSIRIHLYMVRLNIQLLTLPATLMSHAILLSLGQLYRYIHKQHVRIQTQETIYNTDILEHV